jgi:hypothetical protein
MINATPGKPIHSDELARIAYLRTYAYASALELLHKYKLSFSAQKDSGQVVATLYALNLVIALIERDGARQMQEANTTWESAKLVARLQHGGGETDS